MMVKATVFLMISMNVLACSTGSPTVETWMGNVAKTYDKNDKLKEFFIIIREGQNKYCRHGGKSGKKCFTLEGNTFTDRSNPDKTGIVSEQGVINWSGSVTSQLVFPCGQTSGASCTVPISTIIGLDGGVYDTRRIKRKQLIETSTLNQVGSDYCFIGSKSGKRCFTFDFETRLFKQTDSFELFLTGILQPNGRIVWSNGLTTLFEGNLCKKSGTAAIVIICVVVALLIAIGLFFVMKNRNKTDIPIINERNSSAKKMANADNMNVSKNQDTVDDVHHSVDVNDFDGKNQIHLEQLAKQVSDLKKLNMQSTVPTPAEPVGSSKIMSPRKEDEI